MDNSSRYTYTALLLLFLITYESYAVVVKFLGGDSHMVHTSLIPDGSGGDEVGNEGILIKSIYVTRMAAVSSTPRSPDTPATSSIGKN